MVTLGLGSRCNDEVGAHREGTGTRGEERVLWFIGVSGTLLVSVPYLYDDLSCGLLGPS